MTQFELDTSGNVLSTTPNPDYAGFKPDGVFTWGSLSPFTQGYIEALFFTEEESLRFPDTGEGFGGRMNGGDIGFSDLAPETLARIIADCATFQSGDPWHQWLDHAANSDIYAELERGGRDFWFTRNGHGAGFWDGDWPEPYAPQLEAAAKAAGEATAYIGDNGEVYLS